MLEEIERNFNNHYNLNKLKNTAIKTLKECELHNEEVINEFTPYLPEGVYMNEMDIEYRDTIILLSGRTRIGSCFRIRLIVKDRVKGRDIFWYDLEFNSRGEIIDSYFDIFDDFVAYG